jgi:hypothetical protein
MGQLWYWDTALKTLRLGKLTPHTLSVELRTWYSEGEERAAGGYERYSNRWRDLELSGPVAVQDLRIQLGRRDEKVFGAHRYPAGVTAPFERHNLSSASRQ